VPPPESASAALHSRDERAGPGLLARGDPPPYEIHHPGGRARALITCDHASRAFPAALGRLGLAEAATWRHIAWDIGAGELARALSDRLDATAVLAGYSRLVVDCNRRLEDPTCFLAVADGEPVPGNQGLGEADRRARASACYEPYHKAIAGRLQDFHRRGTVPALISVHSFTPVLGGLPRPWHVGVLWDKDARIPLPLLARLRAEPGLVVGDNEPYSGRHPADYTVDRHAESAGLPHVCLEVRQDELATAAGVARWAEILGRGLADILAEETLYQVWEAREPRATGG
jgi:predicted N-formylglutamate amidohydrolase